jgi:hypothetical protein
MARGASGGLAGREPRVAYPPRAASRQACMRGSLLMQLPRLPLFRNPKQQIYRSNQA